jgi:aspartyl-tRNA(Asn)/glutamyl-tRNA(Gln) amidotransferase subunit C
VKITKDQVDYVAHLARLDFSEMEKEKLTAQLNDILIYMDMLNQIDTKGVEPMTHAIAQKNAFREDAIGESLNNELALTNAPDKRGDFFRVPKVIE